MKDSLADICIKTIVNRYSFFRPNFAMLTDDARYQIDQEITRRQALIKPHQIINGRIFFIEPYTPRSDWGCYRL